MRNAHVYASTLEHESRMLRITDALARSGRFDSISLFGMGGPGLPEHEQIDRQRELLRFGHRHASNPGGSLFKLLRMCSWSLLLWRYFIHHPVACINAHSLAVLPLCYLVSRRHQALLVYEPHELETESIASRGLRRLVSRAVERLLIRRCDVVFVVSGAIADWYALNYRIPRPLVIRNVTEPLASRTEDHAALRAEVGLPRDGTVFVYQGAMMPGRGVELLLRAFCSLPELHLLLLGNGPLVPSIIDATARNSNLHYHPAVPPAEVLKLTAAADVGLCLTEAACLSYAYSLPNKLFEYLAAGLPVIVSDLPEQSRFVAAHKCGWIAPSDEKALAKLLTSLNREQITSRRASAAKAAEECRWSREQERMIEVYRTLLDG